MPDSLNKTPPAGVPVAAEPEALSRRGTVLNSPALTAPPARKKNEGRDWGSESTGPDATVLAQPLEPTAVRHDGLEGTALGEYQVLEFLGQGGMGIVYRGVQPMIGKPVAIKVLRPEVAADSSQVQQLLAEARAVNAIRHPGIVDIFSFGTTPDGRQYFVMELLEGQPLDLLLQERGRLLPTDAVEVLDQVLAALGAAHGAGVIHRDLKPGNILLLQLPDGTLRTKLLDFGLAKLTAPGASSTPQTNTAVVRGTPAYMAPEQARGQGVSPKSDLYAMGVLAYELLTGRLPFEAPTVVEVMMKQLSAVPVRPTAVEPSIPDALEALVLQLLAKAPAERPASAAEARRALQRIRKGMHEAGTQLRRGPPQEPPTFDSKRLQVPADPSRPAALAADTSEQVPSVTPLTLEPAPGAAPNTESNAAVDTGSAGRWVLLVLFILAAGLGAFAWWPSAAPPEVTAEPEAPPAPDSAAPLPLPASSEPAAEPSSKPMAKAPAPPAKRRTREEVRARARKLRSRALAEGAVAVRDELARIDKLITAPAAPDEDTAALWAQLDGLEADLKKR